jgi:iron complex transport system ATP-binding protein
LAAGRLWAYELLQAADVTYHYGAGRRPAGGGTDPPPAGRRAHAPVIDGVSLEIPSGALIGLLGPNGSGKTTLLRLLAGTLKPTRGVVRLDGDDLSRIPRHLLARRCAVVPQETHLAFEYTVLEIVLMGRYPHLRAFQFERPEDMSAAVRALEATGTLEFAHRAFATLSGGEKQRVIIASALAQLDESLPQRSPRLLLLDEPTASLDLRYQIEVAQLIARLHRDADVTIVLSTHDLHFAASVCDDVVLLRRGRVLARGRTADVLTAPNVADLYGVDINALRQLTHTL